MQWGRFYNPVNRWNLFLGLANLLFSFKYCKIKPPIWDYNEFLWNKKFIFQSLMQWGRFYNLVNRWTSLLMSSFLTIFLLNWWIILLTLQIRDEKVHFSISNAVGKILESV